MAEYLTVCFFGLAALTAIASFLLTLHAWEHRRYTRGRFREQPSEKSQSTGRVVVIVPCKGLDFDLENNLRRLLVQDYHDYEVHFVVESGDDLACQVIRRLVAERPAIPVQLVIAGRATECGQKIHNLSVATDRLDGSIDTLVFADSDAASRPDWLRSLVRPLAAINIHAVTSYRWLVPRRSTLSNLLLFSINAATMGLVCSRRQAVLWGGTWAVSREVFEKAKIREMWCGRLSDDLVASRRLDKLRLNIAFEPKCVVTSPIDFRGGTMWEFLRRQCFVGRWYRTSTWSLGLAFTSASMLAFWGGILLAAVGIGTARPTVWISALAVSAALWGMGFLRAILRQDAGRHFVQQPSANLRRARRFDICSYPLSLSVVWVGLVTAAIGRTIQWRKIGYRIRRDRTVEVIASDPIAGKPERPRVAIVWPGHSAPIAAAVDSSTIEFGESGKQRRRSA